MNDLGRLTAPLKRRVANMVGRAVIAAVNDAAKAQALQISGLADEMHDDVERLQDYGFTSVPFPGAEAAVVYVGGLRSHGLVVAIEDRRYRLTALKEGEVALYDDQQQVVHLTREGILVKTARKVTIDAGEDVLVKSETAIAIEAPAVNLGGAGGPAVARIGDTVEGGVITSGSGKVFAA